MEGTAWFTASMMGGENGLIDSVLSEDGMQYIGVRAPQMIARLIHIMGQPSMKSSRAFEAYGDRMLLRSSC